MKMKESRPFVCWGVAWTLMMAAVIIAPPLSAHEFDTGIQDLGIELVADFRYNLGARVEKTNPAILNRDLFDEGESRFDAGDIVTNRADVTPQLILKYTGLGWIDSIGYRASGNAFKDYAYNDDRLTCRPGTAPVGAPAGLLGNANPLPLPGGQRISYCDPRILSYSTGRFNKTAKESAFQNAEMLENFGFVNFSVGDHPLSFKVGRHALFWGEALLNPFLGVSYSQGPVDLNKALTVPGISVQDVFRPVNQVSGTATVTNSLSLGFQYFLAWEGVRIPEGGTYLGLADPFLNAPDQLFVANLPSGPLTLKHMPEVPGENRNNFGVQMKWSPEFMDGGTLGFYFRKFDDIMPWVHIIADPSGGPLPVAYRTVYPRGSRLYGLSANQKLFGVSVGTDVAYVPNRALNSQNSFVDDSGLRARGGVWSGVLNSLYLGPSGTIPFTDLKLWDSYVLITELNWSFLDKVTERPDLYKAVDSAACIADANSNHEGTPHADTKDGCSSRYNVGYALVFQPIWYQVFPGIDMNGSLSFINGLKNNSPAASAGNEGFATGSIGVSANFYQKVTAALAYNYYNSQFRTGKNLDGETEVTTFNGGGLLADRDWVSLTLKYSF